MTVNGEKYKLIDLNTTSSCKILYEIIIKQENWRLEILDCYKKDKCNWSCRTADDSDWRYCSLVQEFLSDNKADNCRFAECIKTDTDYWLISFFKEI